MTKIMGDKTTTTRIIDSEGNNVVLDVVETEELLKEAKLVLRRIETHLSILTDNELHERDAMEE